jgi:serine/threonine protein kinase
LAELTRVISCGEVLVEQWTDKDWWMSVVSSSDSASIKERVVLHLNEFLFCVKVLRRISSNGAVPEATSFMPLDLSMPDVEEASRRDAERLVRIVEGYKAKSVPQGAVEKLAELALDKLSATTSDPGHLQFIEYDDVQLAGFLGRGSAGSLFECRFHGQMAAAKIFTSSNSKNVEEEGNLQARLRHPNVVQIIGHAVKQNQHIIVMELMNMDLRRYLEENVRQSQSRPPLSLLLAVDIMLQLAEAMNYLHKSRVMHRDLKSSNVLINAVMSKESYISPSVQVKLTDFGLSKLNLYNLSFSTRNVGTLQWMAPEVGTSQWMASEVGEDEKNTEKYTKAADVYSFAMVFSEVLTGKLPFEGGTLRDLHQRVLKGERPILPPDDYCPVHVSAVIKKCWVTMPEDRPQFHEICQMLWQCKARILSHSSPHSSPWKSEPQKHRNDGGDSGGIVTTGNSENLFQGPGMMANISAGDFRATIEYNDVQIMMEYLGQGGYACVFKCQLHGESAAAKLFNTSNIIEVKAVKNEAKLLASLRHPNVVQFVGYAVKESQHYIITELMSKDLRMYLKENVPLSLPLVVDIMVQIAEGMKYLHESRVMHRDLKADNVLINVVENESCISPSVQVKLTDFGMSKLNLNNSRFTTMGVGTAQWRAPEVFKDKQNTEKYTNAADVYSFALVFFEVLTGEVPFAKISKSQILGEICGGEMPILPPDGYCPWPLSAFIRECWATRPEDRPRFPEICERLQECKDTVLKHSTPNASSQTSTA